MPGIAIGDAMATTQLRELAATGAQARPCEMYHAAMNDKCIARLVVVRDFGVDVGIMQKGETCKKIGID